MDKAVKELTFFVKVYGPVRETKYSKTLYCPVFEQTPKAPRGDAGGRPPGHLFQGMSPRVHGLHEDEPAEDEAMASAPHRGHAAKHQGYKTRE